MNKKAKVVSHMLNTSVATRSDPVL